MISFEITLPCVISVMSEVQYNHIASDKRNIPYPQKAVSKIRQGKAEEKALEAARTSGCPCIMKGYVGEDDGQHITLDTKIIFEWLHVRKRDGDPHVCQISYRNLISLGRPVPNCPMRVQGRPGLLYIVAFFDAFAESIGCQYCGVVYEGAHLLVSRSLPAGGVDILEEPVYWLWPNGLVRCVSARALHRSPRLGHTSWSANLLAS